jgi:hypothetical protein
VDLVWYGRRGIKRRIKKDCGSFLCILNIIIIVWMWLKKFFWGKNVYVALKRKEKNIFKNVFLSLQWKVIDGFSLLFVDFFVLFRI